MPAGTLLIRADASVAIGTGHVMRCLALAQAWQDAGGRAVFVTADLPPVLRGRLLAENCEVVPLSYSVGTTEDASQTIGLARDLCAECTVVDGYQFDANYQRCLQNAGLKVIFIDDYGHGNHYFADVVLNQNVYASEARYVNREPHTRLLLGPRYALLRREFYCWRGWKKETSPIGGRILVTMGGSDPVNTTERVVDALPLVGIKGLEATIVVGGSSPHISTLDVKPTTVDLNLRLLRDVRNMPELMAWADVAVSAAGSTVLELALMGVPAILVITAENQRANAQACQELGIAETLGNARTVSSLAMAEAVKSLLNHSERRSTMARSARSLVDGFGADRVVKEIAANRWGRNG